MLPLPKSALRRHARSGTWRGAAVVMAIALAAGELTAGPAFGAPQTSAAAVGQGTAADFGPSATASSDLAVTAIGDSAGYHLQVSREKSGFAWHEIAVLRPAGMDEAGWTGYQCTSGDGRFEAVTVAPASAANSTAGREHGAFAYSVDLATGRVQPIASGVALEYDSPGCGTGDEAEFSVGFGNDQQSTEILSADLATGRIGHSTKVAGQLTSAVPAAAGVVGVLGSRLVAVPETGHDTGVPQTIAAVSGQPYDLRPAADGGVDFLLVAPGATTAHLEHEKNGGVTETGSGRTTSLNLFSGRAGRNVLIGADQVAHGSAVRAVDTKAITDPQTVSLDGDAVFGAHQTDTRADSKVLASATGKVVSQPKDTAGTTPVTTATSSAVPDGVNRDALNSDLPTSAVGQKSTTGQAGAKADTPNALQTPACSVPRDNPTFQSTQQGSSQIDWAAQMAEQNLLTGSAYARPANFDNLGLVSYSPNSDFAAVPLSHPSSDTWNTVPRSVFEAIMAQESNWDQASWHALPGIAGNPVIADYYGAAGTIDTINYAAADCGYGISQVTTGMFASQTGQQYSLHGQWKIAVDYQENMAAGLQILERTWNTLYAAGITANGGDPRYLENWYFAIWAYNTGIQPDAKHGNTTGCTPGPSCTGADGTWGLGWANNPANPSYPPNRAPYLAYTYADAAHPGDWPYQERVLGWMGTPLVRMGSHAYAQATFNGGSNWLNIPAFNTFCTSAGDLCNPGATGQSGTCTLADYECWWHAPVTWIPNCATTCSTSSYAYGSGSTEPSVNDPHPPVCSLDTSAVPTTSDGPPVIVSAQPGLAAGKTPLNIVGCTGTSNWSNGGTFAMTYGTNANGDPTGAIDTHQLGAGFGGYIMFDHTQDGSEPAVMNTGTWTPTLSKFQYYTIEVHIPATGATTGDATYVVNSGSAGLNPVTVTVNQHLRVDQWIVLGTFGMAPGGTVQLTNKSSMTPGAYDVGYDALAFLPRGGIPGTTANPGAPVGGPLTPPEDPTGTNPSVWQCVSTNACAGDPVNTANGYYGETVTDLTTPGRSAPLDFTRTYASGFADPAGPNGASAVNGPFGYGWTFSYNVSAATDGTTGNVTIHQEDGSQVAFVDTAGVYAPAAPRDAATLVKTGTTYTFTRRGKEIMTFDAATGHLLTQTDPAGKVAGYATTLAYDGSGNLHTITDAAGHVYTLAWTGGHITGLSDSAGRQVSYGYDSSNDLTDVYGVGTTRTPTLKDDDHTTYGYQTGTHLLTSWRQPKYFGDTTTSPVPAMTMTYDSSERVKTQTDQIGRVTTFTYGPATTPSLAAGQTLVADPAGNQWLGTYQNGLLTSETKGYGSSTASTWTYAYDPITLGRTSTTDPDGNVQTASYDAEGNKIASSDARGETTASTYDALNDLTTVVDPLGVQTTYKYDEAGHIKTASGTNDGTLVYGLLTGVTVQQNDQSAEIVDSNPAVLPSRNSSDYYDDSAHPADRTRFVDANGNTSAFAFDGNGFMASETDPAGDKTLYGYNTGTGWRTSKVDPNGVAAGTTTACTPPAKGCTTYQQDAWGHVVKTIDPLGHSTGAVYDTNGNKTSSTDGDGQATTYQFDPANEAVATVNADTTTSHTDYYGDGTVKDTIDPAGNKTSYTYDSQARKSSRTDPDNQKTTYGYDPAGNLTTVTNPDSRVTTNGYDAAGNLTSVKYSATGTPGVTSVYNPAGHRTSMTDGTGTTTWKYDAFGEVVSETSGAGTTVGYGYDNNGNQTSIVYPGGQSQTVIRSFDKANRLSSVTDWNTKKTQFGYDYDGDLTSTTYPNGTVVTRGLTDTDLVSSISAATGSTSLASLTYGRDNAGQVASLAPSGVPGTAQTFGYTPLEQLKSATAGSTAVGYGYDAAADPTSLAGSAQGFDAAGRTCWTLPGTATSTAPCAAPPTGATSYQYDNEGDRTAATPGSGTASTYSYNQAGQLTGYSGANGSVSYGYDGLGLRTSKTAGGTTTTFTWDAGTIADLLYDGSVDYVYGPGGTPVEQIGSAGTYWYLSDAAGSTRALLDANGAIAGTYGYDAFGNVTNHTGTATTPLQYTGGYDDAETGFLYLRARFYDPATAQFITVDPAVDATRSSYGYVHDNPLNAADPAGLWTVGFCLGGAATFLFGGAASGCVVADSTGNLGVEGTVAGVIGTPSAGISGGEQVSDANTVYDLGGPFGTAGGSIGVPGGPSYTLNYSWGNDRSGCNHVHVFDQSVGWGKGPIAEAHAGESNTSVYAFNPVKGVESLWDDIWD
ncbi:RHS repeat-associated protein [Catenulispora sp. GAS73]